MSKTQQLIDCIACNPGLSAKAAEEQTGIRHSSDLLKRAVEAKRPKIGRVKHARIWRYYPNGHAALGMGTPTAHLPPFERAGAPPPPATAPAPARSSATQVPAGDEAAAPRGFRAALWSTGALSLRTGSGELEMDAGEVEALLGYLIHARGAVHALFGDVAQAVPR